LSDDLAATLAAVRGLLDGRECKLTGWLPSVAPERLKFDEFWQKPQNCSTMKSFSVILVFILAAFSAVAQTDTNAIVVPVETNAPAPPSGTNAAAVPAGMSALDPVGGPVGLHGTNATAVPADMNAATRAMSLEDCIQEALQHNLDVQISRYAPQIQLFNVRASYGGYDPTFTISGTHQYNDTGPDFQNAVHIPGTSYEQNTATAGLSKTPTPWGMTYQLDGNVSHTYNYQASLFTNSDNSGGQIGVTLTQPLLNNFWIDQTRLNIRVGKNRLQYSEQGLRLQVITSVTAVETAYYELIYAQENVKVQQEALALAQTQLDQDRQRVQIGTLAQLDVQQDGAQVATSKANLIAAQYTLVTDQNTLKNLLTDEYLRWHDKDIQPTATITNAPLQLFDLQDSWNKGMTERPDLLQSRLNVEQQGILLKFSYNQLFPSLDLIGTYGFNGTGQQFNDTFNQFNAGSRPFYSYGVQLSTPLSNVGPRNTYKAGKVTLQQLLLQLKQFEQNIMVQIDNAVKNAQSTYESVNATRQARIYAEAALDAEQKKYAVGKSTTFIVLQLQNTLTANRAQEIRSLANYYEALVNLAQAEGTTLERNRINIEVK
jgi:HAE1 family hydrophobic/amphiphilic exporter-1